jgi:hypothetical protein
MVPAATRFSVSVPEFRDASRRFGTLTQTSVPNKCSSSDPSGHSKLHKRRALEPVSQFPGPYREGNVGTLAFLEGETAA